jgi:hypothetical protein
MSKSTGNDVNQQLQFVVRTNLRIGAPRAIRLAVATIRAWETIALRMRWVRPAKRLKYRHFREKPAGERPAAGSRYNPNIA